MLTTRKSPRQVLTCRNVRFGLLSAAVLMAAGQFASAGIISYTNVYDVSNSTNGVDPATVAQTDSIDVGNAAIGTMTVNATTDGSSTNGGQNGSGVGATDANVTNLITGVTIIGNGSGSSTSNATVDGGGNAGGATWTINNGTVGTPGNLTVGYNNASASASGTSTLTIKDGGQISNSTSYVGEYVSGSHGTAGTVTVDGTGAAVGATTWTMAGTLQIGYTNNISAGSTSTGTVNISNGALVTVNGTATIDSQASIAVGLGELANNGNTSLGSLYISSGGVLNVTGGGGAVAAVVETGLGGNNTHGVISVDGLGSLLEITTTKTGSGLDLARGSSGTSSLSITNGGAVNIPNLNNAGNGGAATIVVDGASGSTASTLTVHGSLYIGFGGGQTMTITNGGYVNNTAGNDFEIGNNSNSNGGNATVTVGGTGDTGTSILSTVTGGDTLYLNHGNSSEGAGTNGTLNIYTTGSVTLGNNLVLNAASSAGSATVNLGTSVITGGTLNLNGHNVVLSHTQTNAFNFNSGTLEGVGTFGATNAMNLTQGDGTDNAVLIAGQGTTGGAKMSMTGTYELTSASTLQLDLNGTTLASSVTSTAGTYDLYAVTGATTLDTGGILNIVLDGSYTPTAGDTFNVLTGSSVTAGTLTLEQGNSPSSAWTYSVIGGNTLQVEYNPVPTPEPASLSLLALGAVGLLVRRRR